MINDYPSNEVIRDFAFGAHRKLVDLIIKDQIEKYIKSIEDNPPISRVPGESDDDFRKRIQREII